MKRDRVSRFFWVVLGLLLATVSIARAADEPPELFPDLQQQSVVNADFWWTAVFEMSHILSLPWTYSAEAIDAWVFDAETGQPLEGVIVVVDWRLWRGGFHPDWRGSLQVMETVTDAKGHFAFPAWGPKTRPAGMYLFDDPTLYVFKRGYQCATFAGYKSTMKINANSLRRLERNIFKLQKFTGSLEEYASNLYFLDSNLDFVLTHNKDCVWKQFPRMLVALHVEQQRLLEKVRPNSSFFPHASLKERDNSQTKDARAKCGSIEESLRSYLP